MDISVDRDQGVNDDFMWKNQPWSDLTNSENFGGNSSKHKLDKKPMNEKEGINEVEVHVNKKPSRGGAVIRTENNIANGEKKDGRYCDSEKEVHIFTEREMRNKMKNIFASLHALLLELPSKVIYFFISISNYFCFSSIVILMVIKTSVIFPTEIN